ncbi:hypothetical protein Tco_0789271 [Tanacetum coccineum]
MVDDRRTYEDMKLKDMPRLLKNLLCTMSYEVCSPITSQPMNIVEVDVAVDYNGYLVDAVVVERMALIVASVVVVVLLLAAATVDNEAGEVAFADMTEVDGRVMAPPRLRLGTPSGKVTPLFATMLVQPTQDEGAPSERPSEVQPTPSHAPTNEVPYEPQTDSSPAHTSEVHIEQQTDPSPRPSPSTIIPG